MTRGSGEANGVGPEGRWGGETLEDLGDTRRRLAGCVAFKVLAFGAGVGQHGDRLSGEHLGGERVPGMSPEEHGRVRSGNEAARGGSAQRPRDTPGNAADRPGLKGREDPVTAGGCECWDHLEEWWECGGTSLGPGLGTEC